MSDDPLKIVAMTALKILIASSTLKLPMTSMDLLTSVITTEIPDGLIPNSKKFRLTDLSRFDAIMEDLSTDWPECSITISRETGSALMIWDLQSVQSYASSDGHTTDARLY